MGFIANILGGGGNTFQPERAPIEKGTSVEDVQQQYGQSRQTAAQQQALANQMAGTGAVQQQAQVGQQMGRMAQLFGQRAGANNIDFGQAQQTLGLSQGLLGQLLAQGRGEGPSPAQLQYAQNVAQLLQQQSGALASARGINPALAARLATQQGAGMLQGAAGQAATLRAQETLAAQQAAGQLAGQQIGYQSQLAQNQAAMQQQYAQLAAQQLAAQGQLTGEQVQQLMQQQATMGAQGLTQQQIQQQALANYNAQMVAQQGDINRIRAGVEAQNTQMGANMLGNLTQAGGAALGFLAEGGIAGQDGYDHESHAREMAQHISAIHRQAQDVVPGYADGGNVWQPDLGLGSNAFTEPPMLEGMRPEPVSGGPSKLSQALQSFGGSSKNQDTLWAFDRFANMPGARAQVMACGGVASHDYRSGGKVEAHSAEERAVVAGDSEKNDKVPAMLSEGEAVIPRSAMRSPEAAHDFLDHLLKKKGQSGAFKRYAKTLRKGDE